jgi:hypothetical protein
MIRFSPLAGSLILLRERRLARHSWFAAGNTPGAPMPVTGDEYMLTIALGRLFSICAEANAGYACSDLDAGWSLQSFLAG